MTDGCVDTHAVGAARVSIILDGTLRWAPDLQVPEEDWRRALPEADEQGALDFASSVAHVALDGASVLIDLGVDDPGPCSEFMPPAYHRTPGVEAGLARLGVRPEDVTHVLITHLHGDHVAGALTTRDGRQGARFPHARHLIGRGDWDLSRHYEEAISTRSLTGLDALGLLEAVDGDLEVIPGIDLLHAPGESPGHSIVRVTSQGETFYHLGDLFHHPVEVENVEWVSPGRDRAVMAASRRKVIDAAVKSNALLAFSHGRFPAWGRLERQADHVRWVWA